MRETRWQLFLLVLAALFYPQTEDWLRPWQLTVDYPFLLLFWIALRRGVLSGILFGFCLGLLRDLADHAQLGATALAFTIGGFGIGKLRDKIDRDNLATRILLLMLSYLVVKAIFFLPFKDWSLPAAVQAWLRFALPGSILNAAVYLLSLGIVWFVREGAALLHEPTARR